MHIRTKLLGALFAASPVQDEESNDAMVAFKGFQAQKVFFSDPVVVRLLMPGLIQLFVDMERNASDPANWYHRIEVPGSNSNVTD